MDKWIEDIDDGRKLSLNGEIIDPMFIDALTVDPFSDATIAYNAFTAASTDSTHIQGFNRRAIARNLMAEGEFIIKFNGQIYQGPIQSIQLNSDVSGTEIKIKGLVIQDELFRD